MPHNQINKEYLKRIHAVIDYIETNLDTDLSLESLARKANYSAYHFHRVFSTVVGERLNGYINRKRIERIASILLVEPDTVLKDLAYQYGFTNDSSLSRAFKKYYDVSPTVFKSEGEEILSKIGIEDFSIEKYIRSVDNLKKWTEMNTKIAVQQLQNIELASITHIGAFDQIASMYQQLIKWGSDNNIFSTPEFKAITIYHDNPNITHSSKVRFSACITTKNKIKADGKIRPLSIQKGYYAIGRFEIVAEEIPTAWKSMNTWVIENNLEFKDGDYFEMYHNDYQTHPEQKFILDICIPVKENSASKTLKTNSVNEETIPSYHQLIHYMKSLKTFFHNQYDVQFKLGNVYQGNPDFSYFSLTTEALKNQKLKFVIVLNHKLLQFSICLSGQNKNIRKQYWKLFYGSDYKKYNLAKDIDNSLSIIDTTITTNADFSNKSALTKLIEKETILFINEITAILK